MPLDLTDDKSTLVQVMAWCRQATSYYLSQCWPRFMSPYGVTLPQYVNWNFLKFVPKGPVENRHDNPAFVEVMAWCWTGNKTFHVLIMTQLLPPCDVTRPGWVYSMVPVKQCTGIIFSNIFLDPLYHSLTVYIGSCHISTRLWVTGYVWSFNSG